MAGNNYQKATATRDGLLAKEDKAKLAKFTEDATGRPKYNDKGLVLAGEAAALTQAEVDKLQIGRLNLFTARKNEDGSMTFSAGIEQVDKLVPAEFDTLLADTAAWVGDQLTLTGDNREGLLGQNSQEHQMTGQFYLCISHNFGTTATNGSATWVRNRSKDCLTPGIASDDAVITAITTEAGWDNVNQVKVIGTRSKVGSWYTSTGGYVYFCFAESGNSWYWRRIGFPSTEPMEISEATHPILVASLKAHDFTAGWYTETNNANNEAAQQGQKYVDYTNQVVYERYQNAKWRKA